MPKSFDLNVLKQIVIPAKELLGAQQAKSNPNYFLFMLGTDTVFTPAPTKKSQVPAKPTDYDNGETLSYMAQVVAQRLNEKPEKPTEPLSFSSSSIDVVNGPTTLGSEVGERIAQGVFLVLKALSEGRSNIQIAAHSRGAVETILITHELERIKEVIKQSPSKSIYSILKDSPCAFTKKAVEKLFKEANESLEVKQEIAKRISSAKVNLFLIDPVPGGSYRGLYGIAWRDDRFYVKPPCASLELLICRDERSRCFKAIIPNGVTPLLIPGHHGTASGNLYSQQAQPVPANIKENDISTAQHLTVVKLFTFINMCTKLFDTAIGEPINLQHPELDKTTNAFCSTQDPQIRSKQLFELYKKVHANNPGFEYFTKTSYAFLSPEYSHSRTRMVHYGAHNSMSLDAIIPGLNGAFVNSEHALLYLHEQMSFALASDEVPLEQLIMRFSNTLNSIFTAYKNGDERQIKAKVLLEKVTDRKVTFEALSFFINTISQKYLRNHLSLDTKTALLAELDKTFKVLASFKTANQTPLNGIIAECETILRAEIKHTAETHYKSLKECTAGLVKQLKYFLASNQEFGKAFGVFLAELKRIIDANPNQLLQEVRQELNDIYPITIDTVKAYFNGKIPRIQNGPWGILTEVLQGPKGIASYFIMDSINYAEFLEQLDLLHDNIVVLTNGLDHIQELAKSDCPELDVDELTQHQDRIIKLAARILIHKNIDLRIKPAGIKRDEFFNIVKARAISLGANNPELVGLREELGSLKVTHDALNKSYQKITDELSSLKATHSALEGAHKQTKEEQVTLIRQLTSPKESTCANLIDTKLIPLTNAYLHHLNNEAEKINPSFKIDKTIFSGAEENKPAYEKIIAKLSATEKLSNHLTANIINPLASERILRFVEALKATNVLLKEHRDSPWMLYFRNSLLVIGIVCSGIIPGIAALLCYSIYADKSPLFFAESKGTQFVDKTKRVCEAYVNASGNR